MSTQPTRRPRRKSRRRTKLKPRNKLLIFAVLTVLLYAGIDIAYGFISLRYMMPSQLDATLTSEVIGFCKWVVTTGAAITITKTVKGSTNSDEDELPPDGDYSG